MGTYEIKVKPELNLFNLRKQLAPESRKDNMCDNPITEDDPRFQRYERESIRNLRKFLPNSDRDKFRHTISCPCGRMTAIPEETKFAIKRNASERAPRSKVLTGATLPVPVSGLRRRHTFDKPYGIRSDAAKLDKSAAKKVAKKFTSTSISHRRTATVPTSSPSWRRIKASQLNGSASRVLWEINSGFGAVKECGLNWSKNVSSAGGSVGVHTNGIYTRSATMTDAKFQELKRSISSWSLSTFKKPKLTGPLFRKPRLNVFSSKQKSTKEESKPAILDDRKVNNNSKSKNLKAEDTVKDENVHETYENSTKVIQGEEKVELDNDQQKSYGIFPDHTLNEIEKIKYIDDDESTKHDIPPSCQLVASTTDQDSHSTSNQFTNDILQDDDLNGGHPATNCLEDKSSDQDLSQAKCHIRSCSEIKYQPRAASKYKTKDEIVLNSSEPKTRVQKIRPIVKLFKKEKKVNDEDSKMAADKVPEKDGSILSTSQKLKKIFGIRRKLSIKPFIDSDAASIKDEDIRMAIIPMALTDSIDRKKFKPMELHQDSLDESFQDDNEIINGDTCYPNSIISQELKAKISEEDYKEESKEIEDDALVAEVTKQNERIVGEDTLESEISINNNNNWSNKVSNQDDQIVKTCTENTDVITVTDKMNVEKDIRKSDKITIEITIDDDNYVSKEKMREKLCLKTNLSLDENLSENTAVIRDVEKTKTECKLPENIQIPQIPVISCNGNDVIIADKMTEDILSESMKSASSLGINRSSLIDDIIIEESSSSSETIHKGYELMPIECNILDVSDEEYIHKLVKSADETGHTESCHLEKKRTELPIEIKEESGSISSTSDIASVREQLGGNIRPSTLAIFPPSFPKLPFRTKRDKTRKKSGDNKVPDVSIKISNSSVNSEELPNSKDNPIEDLNSPKLNPIDYENTKFPANGSPSTETTNVNSPVNKEPLYWEIDNDLTSPMASPRKRKERCSPSVFKPARKSVSTMNLPQWIQQRPPIPSPRTKKQSSTQSLQFSHTPWAATAHDVAFENLLMKAEFQTCGGFVSNQLSSDEFYSGKAASIAYGITSDRIPPPVPLRSKKPSLISLQSNSTEDRILVKSSSSANSEANPTYQRRRKRKFTPILPRNDSNFKNNSKNTYPKLIDVLNSIGVLTLSNDEDLLEDVLFSVNSLMRNRNESSTWLVKEEHNIHDQKYSVVTLDQIKAHLQDTFQVSDDKMLDVWEAVLKRKSADVSLFVKVIGAKGLRPKTVKGGSNPYAIISLANCSESRRTRLEHETLNPTWNQEFSLKVNNLYTEQLLVQVWHEYQSVDVDQVTSIRDIRGLGRLMKETNATISNKQEAHLLGQVKIALTELKGGTYTQCIPLQKETGKDSPKDRGSIIIQIEVGTPQNDNSEQSRRSLDNLLARMIYAHIKGYLRQKKEDEINMPWAGKLNPEAKATLVQHSIILGLREYVQSISWWLIPAKFPSVDTGWLYGNLRKLQDGIAKGIFEQSDLDLLATSFASYNQFATHMLINMQTAFPTASGVLSKHQLTYMLRILKNLQEAPKTKAMLEEKNVPDPMEQTKGAVLDHVKIWWNKLMDDQLTGVAQTEEQIKKIIVITQETFVFLAHIEIFYSPILSEEMSIPFFQETYLLLTQKVNPCVRPLLVNIFSKSTNLDSTTDDHNQFSLQSGSLVWQLYTNLSKIYQLGLELPLDVREHSGIHEYHRWFTKGILRFLEVTSIKSKEMIKKAVELDSFEPIDEYCNCSSSVTDMTMMFVQIKIWWKKLSWPDPENSGVLLAKIMEDVCNCGIIYSDLLRSKVDMFFTEHSKTGKPNLISKQICIGLNNIDRVRMELTTLPNQFAVDELSEKIHSSPTGGERAANVFKENIKMLINNSTENMEMKVIEFIETVIERMIPTLQDAVTKSIDEESEKHLLGNILDPSLHLLKETLEDNNFIHVIRRLWDVIIEIFHDVANKNANKRKASYFGVINDILQKTRKFFSPSVGIALTMEEATTSEYIALSSLINSLSLSSENLISKYYMARYEEQYFPGVTPTAELVINALFTKNGKLTVEVIMAKNMTLNADSSSSNSRLHLTSPLVDSYIKVQFLPNEWFPHVMDKKTKTMRKVDPAVYDETFEFDISYTDNGVSEGIILFTLKDYKIGRSNTFIGEAALPFKNIPCVDSSAVNTVKNTFLKMTVPGSESSYKSLLILKQRTNDKVATNFCKKITRRFPEHKSIVGHIFSHSSDEEKSGHGKSPVLPSAKK